MPPRQDQGKAENTSYVETHSLTVRVPKTKAMKYATGSGPYCMAKGAWFSTVVYCSRFWFVSERSTT